MLALGSTEIPVLKSGVFVVGTLETAGAYAGFFIAPGIKAYDGFASSSGSFFGSSFGCACNK